VCATTSTGFCRSRGSGAPKIKGANQGDREGLETPTTSRPSRKVKEASSRYLAVQQTRMSKVKGESSSLVGPTASARLAGKSVARGPPAANS